MSWRRMGEWKYNSIISFLSTRWRWLVSFTPLPRYPRRNRSPAHCWAPVAVWKLRRREKPYTCRNVNPGCPNRSSSLYRLSYPGSIILKYVNKNTLLFECIIFVSNIYKRIHSKNVDKCKSFGYKEKDNKVEFSCGEWTWQVARTNLQGVHTLFPNRALQGPCVEERWRNLPLLETFAIRTRREHGSPYIRHLDACILLF
jgi:hypothetical protein